MQFFLMWLISHNIDGQITENAQRIIYPGGANGDSCVTGKAMTSDRQDQIPKGVEERVIEAEVCQSLALIPWTVKRTKPQAICVCAYVSTVQF